MATITVDYAVPPVVLNRFGTYTLKLDFFEAQTLKALVGNITDEHPRRKAASDIFWKLHAFKELDHDKPSLDRTVKFIDVVTNGY